MSHRLPADRSESVFPDYKEAYSPEQARVEANRCLFCHDAPCITACPTSIDIPQFIRKIASGNQKNSARTIFESNILGMSCARVCPVEVLCVGDCVYNHMDAPPIQIGKLQRYVTDLAFENRERFFEAGPATGKSVALVGAGPASLAAAHELRRLGHACTIYEKRDLLGGLNTTGVAPYKMKADRSLEEVEWILGIGGIDVQTGVTIGEDLTFKNLEEKHDAVFLGIGLGPDSKLGISGEDLEEVHGAVEFIEKIKLGTVELTGIECCVVIGAGNTAVDCVRQLLGLGVKKVRMLYRGPQSRMSGYAHEWQAAVAEGAKAAWHVTPQSFKRTDFSPHSFVMTYRSSAEGLPDKDFPMETELALVAIGQSKLGGLVAGLEGIEVDKGRIVVDHDGKTKRPGFYAGGDCTNGGKEVVNAAAEGKRSAIAIDRYLKGGE
ncbi:MAG: dihydropyrimidine dehydrogenase (NAD+) subunit PreT [Planctomycetota bacterium]|jgi:dihydropyrimidine dehydrogenase (NAD+) subunit PreT